MTMCRFGMYTTHEELGKRHIRGHIFSPIIMKHGQNVSLDKILNDFENGSCRVKN